jgi:hypothetical protein
MKETNEILTQEEIKKRLNSGNACYHSIHNLLSSRTLSKNVKITIHKSIIFPVVLYRCETWFLTLGKEHGLSVFENSVLGRICGPKRNEVIGLGELHNEELHNLYCLPNVIRVIKSGRMRWAGHVA